MNVVAGNFTYPPQNSNLKFDYRDSIVTSWVTDDSYATQGVLTLWYWLLNAQKNWTLSSVIEAVPANGSKSVAVDVGATSDYLGQFNINYNSNDGIQQKYDSQIFQVLHDLGEISPTTWNQQALSTTSLGSPTTSKLQAASTDGSMTTSTTTSALTSTGAPKISCPSPHLATAIGLGVGIPFGIATMGLIGFLFWKKMNSDRRRSKGMSQTPATFVDKGKIMGELDEHQRHLELSVGRLDAELDASPSTL